MERPVEQVMTFALHYAADGFAVFPIYEPAGIDICSCSSGASKERNGKPHSIGKHPRTENGCSDATTDPNKIREWWTKWPNASIGIATGKKSGLAVIDLDGPEGMQSGDRLRLQSTVSVLTGNGKQLYYADPSGLLDNSVKKLSPGMDTRGNGGYVLAPPSLHPSGKRYVWSHIPLSRIALPPLPALSEATSRASDTMTFQPKPADWISEALEDMRKGHVANTLVSVLGKFRHHNFSEEDTYKLLVPHALVNGQPFEGLRAKIAEIWKRYQSSSFSSAAHSEDIEEFLKDSKEVDWLCKPFFAKKSIGFVAGLQETLKTWLCVDLAIECARGGGEWVGLFPTKGCKVLFVDQERWKGETQRRFSALLTAKSLDRTSLRTNLFLKCGTTIRLNIDASYQAFRSELLEMRPDLVIVDSFATFHTLSENDRTEIQKVLERIKELRNEIGCTFLFINHESKMAYPNGEPQGEPTIGTMVGSVGIPAAAEFCLTVRKVEANTSMIWHTKSTLAQKAKPFYASVVDVPEGIVVRGLNK